MAEVLPQAAGSLDLEDCPIEKELESLEQEDEHLGKVLFHNFVSVGAGKPAQGESGSECLKGIADEIWSVCRSALPGELSPEWLAACAEDMCAGGPDMVNSQNDRGCGDRGIFGRTGQNWPQALATHATRVTIASTM